MRYFVWKKIFVLWSNYVVFASKTSNLRLRLTCGGLMPLWNFREMQHLCQVVRYADNIDWLTDRKSMFSVSVFSSLFTLGRRFSNLPCLNHCIFIIKAFLSFPKRFKAGFLEMRTHFFLRAWMQTPRANNVYTYDLTEEGGSMYCERIYIWNLPNSHRFFQSVCWLLGHLEFSRKFHLHNSQFPEMTK